MLLQNSTIRIVLIFLFGMLWACGCSSNQPPVGQATAKPITTPKVSAFPSALPATLPADGPIDGTSTSPAAGSLETIGSSIALPVKRQVAPADIQSQVQWFDGGASGGVICDQIKSCQQLMEDDPADMQIFQIHSYPTRSPLYEGEPILVCVKGLPPRAKFQWSINSPLSSITTGTGVVASDGFAGFCPPIDYRRGIYTAKVIGNVAPVSSQFELLSSDSPHIWTYGELRPGQNIAVYYAGFAPSENIITAWYSNLLAWKSEDWLHDANAYRALYLTSWQTTMDQTGRGTTAVYIPTEMPCVPVYSLLAAFGDQNLAKQWAILGRGFSLDVFAKAVTEIVSEGPTCSPEKMDVSIENSSRFLSQVYKGTILNGETKSDVLESAREAHNWIYEARAGEPFSIQLAFPNNDLPVARISVVDPSGSLVYQCANPIYGCETSVSAVEYSPIISGPHAIRVDMYGEGNGVYEISVNTQKDQAASVSEIIIDDSSRGVELGGPADSWRIASYGYNGSMHWTFTTDRGVSNWVRWTSALPKSGNYEVSVFIPERDAGSQQAHYQVHHNGAVDEVVVRQYVYTNAWVSLGKFWFIADGTEYVYLDDNTGEPLSNRIPIGFDAVRFVYVP